jgi:hypothetical protein
MKRKGKFVALFLHYLFGQGKSTAQVNSIAGIREVGD